MILAFTNIRHKKIYDSGKKPEDLIRYLFIALPKNEIEIYRRIGVMQCIMKLIIQVLMNRARSRIEPAKRQEQYGFVKDTGKINFIFTLRMISERIIEMQKDIYRMRWIN